MSASESLLETQNPNRFGEHFTLPHKHDDEVQASVRRLDRFGQLFTLPQDYVDEVETSVRQLEFDAMVARKYPTRKLDEVLNDPNLGVHCLEEDREAADREWANNDKGKIPPEVLGVRRAVTDAIVDHRERFDDYVTATPPPVEKQAPDIPTEERRASTLYIARVSRLDFSIASAITAFALAAKEAGIIK